MSNSQNYSASSPINNIGKITLLLIIINVGLFVIQVLSGVNITDPTTLDALRWGADYAPLTFLEEPYRLFTSMFFHFGILHLMMNMWALYVFGDVAEKTFGRFYFLGHRDFSGLWEAYSVVILISVTAMNYYKILIRNSFLMFQQALLGQ